jgi:outer membrane protein assembly factor BamB
MQNVALFVKSDAGRCFIRISIFLIILSIAIFPSRAQCHPKNVQQRFGINEDYVYVLPHSGLIKKIHKDTGEVIWKTQIMVGDSDTYLLTWGSYTKPVFKNNQMFAVELYDQRLLGIDCENGRTNLDWFVGYGCIYSDESGMNIDSGFPFGRMTTCDQLAMVFDSRGIQAYNLLDKTVEWIFNCNQRDLYWLHDFFKVNESLYLFISRPSDGISWETLSSNPQSLESELVELKYATGEVVTRYGKDVFFGDNSVRRWNLVELGEWQGKTLLLVKTELVNYSLFELDPISKSISLLMNRQDDYGPAQEAWWDGGVKPVLLGDSIFYQPACGIIPLLIGRSVTDGKIQWQFNLMEGEKLYTGLEERLYSLILEERRFTVICRKAATGEMYWKRKIKVKGEDKDTISSHIEMQVREENLYLLTGGYMRAFDTANGKMRWEVPLYPEKSLWERIIGFFD